MGSDAGLRDATSSELAAALVEARIDALQRKAVLAADRSRLDFILGAQPNVCCLVHFSDSGEEHEGEAEESTKQAERKAAAQLSPEPVLAAA